MENGEVGCLPSEAISVGKGDRIKRPDGGVAEVSFWIAGGSGADGIEVIIELGLARQTNFEAVRGDLIEDVFPNEGNDTRIF